MRFREIMIIYCQNYTLCCNIQTILVLNKMVHIVTNKCYKVNMSL